MLICPSNSSKWSNDKFPKIPFWLSFYLICQKSIQWMFHSDLNRIFWNFFAKFLTFSKFFEMIFYLGLGKKFHLVKYFEVQVSKSQLRISPLKNIEKTFFGIFGIFQNFSQKNFRSSKFYLVKYFKVGIIFFFCEFQDFINFSWFLSFEIITRKSQNLKNPFKYESFLWESLWYSSPSLRPQKP